MVSMTLPPRQFGIRNTTRLLAMLAAFGLFAAMPAPAAEPAKRSFDLPAEGADKSLKRFSEQAGIEVLFPTQIARPVRTHAVKGEMTPRAALDAMLANTGLVVIQDPKTQAFSVRRESDDPNVERAAPKADRPNSPKAGAAAAPPETVVLSPFEVTSAADDGYAASTALTGTRTNEKLANLPNSITVITADFMKDFAITDFFGAVEYGVSAENIYNGTGVVGAPVGAASSNQILVRGIPSLRQLRDGFVWFVAQDSYNIERIEFNRGPGGAVYGDVDPVGVLNISTKRPNARRLTTVAAQYDSLGSRRFTLDANQPLPHRLGLRLNAVNSDIEKSRQRADTIQRAYAGAMRWQPFKNHPTKLDVNFERGHYRLNLAALQINDGISAYVRGSGTNALDADPAAPGTQVNGVGMRQVVPATGNLHSFVDIGGILYDLKSTATVTYRNSVVVTGATAATGADPQNPQRIPLRAIAYDITPYGKDWGGPDNHTDTDYSTYNLEVTHRLGQNLTLLFAHNGQAHDTTISSTFSGAASLGSNSRTLFIDVNRVLPNPSVPGATIPNPRFEQLFVAYAPVFQSNGVRATGWRTSAVHDAKLPFWAASVRSVAGASYRHERNYNNFTSYTLTQEEMARRGITGAAATFPNNVVNPIRYLADGNSDQALALKTQPGVARFYRNGANNTRYDQTLGAASLNVLGSFFKERLHTISGVSREYFRQNRNLPGVADALGEFHFVDLKGSVLGESGNYGIPVAPFNRAYSTNQSYGGVWRVVPWLSVGAGRFESSLFTESITSDLAGRPALPRKGSGHDYSLRFNLLGERVNATITRFDTVAENNVLALSAGAVTELNALLPADRRLVGTGDYRDQSTKGWEFELQSNLSPNWTMRATYSVNWSIYTRFYPLVQPYLALARSAATARGQDPDNATAITRQLIASTEGAAGNLRRETANLATRYKFSEGALRGVGAGVGGRYVLGRPVAAVVSGGQVIYPAARTGNYVLINPFVNYRRKVFGRTVTVQLNVNNVLDRRSQQWLVQQAIPFFTEPRQFVTTVTIDL